MGPNLDPRRAYLAAALPPAAPQPFTRESERTATRLIEACSDHRLLHCDPNPGLPTATTTRCFEASRNNPRKRPIQFGGRGHSTSHEAGGLLTAPRPASTREGSSYRPACMRLCLGCLSPLASLLPPSCDLSPAQLTLRLESVHGSDHNHLTEQPTPVSGAGASVCSPGRPEERCGACLASLTSLPDATRWRHDVLIGDDGIAADRSPPVSGERALLAVGQQQKSRRDPAPRALPTAVSRDNILGRSQGDHTG